MKGKVKWFNNPKGFGFIEHEGKDYFAHYKEIITKDSFKTLIEGSYVEFDPFNTERGLSAKNIKAADKDGNAA